MVHSISKSKQARKVSNNTDKRHELSTSGSVYLRTGAMFSNNWETRFPGGWYRTRAKSPNVEEALCDAFTPRPFQIKDTLACVEGEEAFVAVTTGQRKAVAF
ncbi:hypothetical protein BKA70DRAFT_1216572 [Coprinopsis sp. MPI-PUGE-AT-0042]|nr:hypothetical protein BKA70DRAFT_1216572 [Coprinopsis sp. MPI-PUGE-AT-0042]